MSAFFQNYMGVDPATFAELAGPFGWTCFAVIVIYIAVLLAIENTNRKTLLTFTDFLTGKVAGTMREPVFEGLYKDFNFTITTFTSGKGSGCVLKIKFFKNSDLKMRIRRRTQDDVWQLWRLTLLKRVEIGDTKFDEWLMIHASNPERAHALFSEQEVMQALDSLFNKLNFKYLYIRNGTVEAIWRFVDIGCTASQDLPCYKKDNVLLAVESLHAVSKSL